MTSSEFEAYIVRMRSAYQEMTQDKEHIGMRVVGHTEDIVVAFERFLETIGTTEPHSEMGHVMDAVTSTISTMLGSFASIATNDRQDVELFRDLVTAVLGRCAANLLEPHASDASIIKIPVRAN